MRLPEEIDYNAPFQRAIELVGKRWSACVVRALLTGGEVRYNTLLHGIPDISDRVLTERLRELEDEGLVQRSVDPGPPVRVTYHLTPRGRELRGVFDAVDGWAAGQVAS
jgi:DNA-binding HxlR family transcriptional regulator